MCASGHHKQMHMTCLEQWEVVWRNIGSVPCPICRQPLDGAGPLSQRAAEGFSTAAELRAVGAFSQLLEAEVNQVAAMFYNIQNAIPVSREEIRAAMEIVFRAMLSDTQGRTALGHSVPMSADARGRTAETFAERAATNYMRGAAQTDTAQQRRGAAQYSAQTDRSATQTNTSGTQTDTGATQTDTGATQTDTGAAQTNTSGTQTDTGAAQTLPEGWEAYLDPDTDETWYGHSDGRVQDERPDTNATQADTSQADASGSILCTCHCVVS